MTRRYDRRAFLRRAGGASVTAVAASLAGCASGGAAGGGGGDGDNTVDMNDNLQFDPKELSVSVGDTVTWKNVGAVGHSVTAYEEKIPDGAEYFASGEFDSEKAARKGYPAKGNVPAEESYEHTFEVAGKYEYFCIPHEASGMVGTVRVTE